MLATFLFYESNIILYLFTRIFSIGEPRSDRKIMMTPPKSYYILYYHIIYLLVKRKMSIGIITQYNISISMRY